MKKVRITVLKASIFEEFADRYLSDGRNAGPCPILKQGDTFWYESGAKMPEGFCPWAWVDIYHHVNAIVSGATYAPWFNRDGRNVLCCTDGIRPVSFLVEAVDENVPE